MRTLYMGDTTILGGRIAFRGIGMSMSYMKVAWNESEDKEINCRANYATNGV